MTALIQLARGISLVGLIGVGIFSFLLLVGLVTGVAPPVILGAAIAAGVLALTRSTKTKLESVGSLLVGLLALGFGVASGFGWLELSMVVAAFVAVSMSYITVSLRWTADARVLGWLGLVLMALVLAPLVINGGTFGHDESAYALKGRTWLEGTPDTGWNLHRGPGLSLYAFLVLGIGGAESALRLFGLVSVLGLAVAIWWLGRVSPNRWVGPMAAVAVLSGPIMLRRGTEFLSDIPSAALLVLCMVIVWKEFGERDLPTYRLLLVLPLAWAAFYVRYQSVLALGLVGIAILALWWDKVRAKPGPLLVGAVVGLAGLVPHFLFSISETGSPLGILRFTTYGAGRQFNGGALIDYAAFLAWPLALFVGPIALVLFMWWLVRSWRDRGQRRRALFLFIPAAGQVLVMGALSQAESRFVFFAFALTLLGGTAGLFELKEGWRPRVSTAIQAVLATLLVGSLVLSVGGVRRSVENRALSNEPVELAADVVVELAESDSCAVLTSYAPQITFYTSCATDIFRDYLEPQAAVDRLDGDDNFIVLIEDGKRQPTGPELDGLLDLTTGQSVSIEGERDSATVYEFEQ